VIVTRGATDEAPAHAPAWGLGRALMHEHPALRCTLIDLGPGPLPADQLAREIVTPDGEDQILLTDDQRRVARLAPAPSDPRTRPAAGRSFRLEQDTPGVLNGLHLRAHPRTPPAPGHVEIAVEAAGLNFLDVLRALAVMPDDGTGLGAECVGTVVALAADVDDLQLGDRVVALADGALGTHVVTPRALVVALPPGLDITAAATLPIATLTAWQALHHVARLRAGERVLIHAAAGGVGQAAVQIALARGAVVFATAGTPAKRAMLTAQGVHHVSSSRDRSFVPAILDATAGEGVDVVLNSLAGELLAASLEVLRDDGRFIEIGKRDYLEDRKIGLAPFLRRLTWSLVDLRGMMQDPSRLRPLLAEVAELWRSGVLRPLAHRVVPITSVHEAFTAMARGQHTGKLVIDLTHAAAAAIAPPRAPSFHDRPGVVLLTRATAITLHVARTLIDLGAAHLVVLDPERTLTDHDLQILPRHVRVDRLRTLADLAGLTILAAIHTPPITPPSPLHASAPNIEPALAEAWQLHHWLAAHPVEHAIFCTHASATLGAPGQAPAAAIDCFLAALARHRRAHDLPALCIESDDLTPDEATLALRDCLARDTTHALALRLHPRRWRETHLARARAPLLADLHDEASTNAPLRAQLLALDPRPRAEALQSHLLAQTAAVLRRDAARIGLDDPLQQAGLDSLMALELRNRLESTLDLSLSPTVIWRHPTLRSLHRHLLELLEPPIVEQVVIPDAPGSLTRTSAPDELAGIAAFLAEVAALADISP
jgi:NADPH:quinone reductase-like Zn-dependent oxidoreductase/acyl carrier protein